MVEMYQRLAAGHSLNGIAQDLEGRGIRSRSRMIKGVMTEGKTFTSGHLRLIVLAASYAGKRTHAPNTTPRDSHTERAKRATLFDAAWEPLVPMSLWLAVKHRLEDPARKTSRPGRGVHLLSMIARCDVCGGVLMARLGGSPPRREYLCRGSGHVRICADDLDAVATDAMLAFLTDPANAGRFAATGGTDEAMFEAHERQAAIRAELDDLADKVGRGDLSPSLAARAEPGMLTRLAEADRRIEDLVAPNSLRGLLDVGDDRALASWQAAPMSAKREVARQTLTPAMVGELRVRRTVRRGPHVEPAADRIVWAR